MKLIINADDFGLSRGTNYGIIDAYKNGVVRSTSIMAGMPAFDHAVELIQSKFNIEEVYNEFSAQIQKVINNGIEITHLDSHHHVHTLKSLKPIMERLIKEYNLPIRGGLLYELDYDKVISYNGFFYDKTVSIDGFKKLDINKNEVLETMTHPAYLDSFIMENSSYNLKRIEELKILTSKELKDYIEKNNIELCNYRDI